MDFFNIGGLELLLILLIALIALGPNRIVKVGHSLGELLRKLSKNVIFREVVQTTDEIRNYPRKILDEAKLDMADLDMSKKIHHGNNLIDREREDSESLSLNDLPYRGISVQKNGENENEQLDNEPNTPTGP